MKERKKGKKGKGILSTENRKDNKCTQALLRGKKAKGQGALAAEARGARSGPGNRPMARCSKRHASELRLNPKPQT